MSYLSRFVIALGLFSLSLTPSTGQLVSFMETELRGVDEERVELPGGAQLPVLIQDDGSYGPLLDNYPMLMMVGYVNLARLHIVQGVVVQVEVLDMQQ